ESAALEKTTAPALLVEDSVTELSSGQMRRSEFLSQLRTEVCCTVETAIAGTGRSTEDCPYLDNWFGYYSRQDSAHIERVIRRYAPDASNATTARAYISAVTQRARQSAETWARTGEITGVPEGMPTRLPGTGLLSNLLSRLGGIFFKARVGGARTADDPQIIQRELGEGQPLDSDVRSRMESAFGMDFAHVRMHTDSTAAGLSNRLNARAFTVGPNVAFGSDEYQPGTLLGDALIAHELAHVVQQGGTSASVASMEVGDTDYNALEKDADKSAVGAVVSIWDGVTESVSEIAINAIPRLRSGLRVQRCSTTRPAAQLPGVEERTNAPDRPAKKDGLEEKERIAGEEKAEKTGGKETETKSSFCAIPSDHDGIIALLGKAKEKKPKGNLAYGFTFWAPKSVATFPELKIDWKKSGAKWIGAVQKTTTAMGAIEALYLKKNETDGYKIPGKKVTAKFPQCGAAGKKVPFFSLVSKDMSLLSRDAEQEHCDDYKRAFELTLGKWSDIINSTVGTPFGPGSKGQVEKSINITLKAKGHKGQNGWIKELNHLTPLSLKRDTEGWHSLKPDGAPVTADATCSKLVGHTIKTTDTKIPGPTSKELIK
ncbi:MAG: DUF4157 domain-containing protein, partial [Proteobacteria bacterium]|nr:DUF4157 domain-containing protein [Pseudomonadota bacterium]